MRAGFLSPQVHVSGAQVLSGGGAGEGPRPGLDARSVRRAGGPNLLPLPGGSPVP